MVFEVHQTRFIECPFELREHLFATRTIFAWVLVKRLSFVARVTRG
jgi:hypothetical protein